MYINCVSLCSFCLEVIAVGDGANDIPMLLHAGMGVAFCAKPKVQERADIRLNNRDLSNLLFLLGIHEQVRSLLIMNLPRVTLVKQQCEQFVSFQVAQKLDTTPDGGSDGEDTLPPVASL